MKARSVMSSMLRFMIKGLLLNFMASLVKS